MTTKCAKEIVVTNSDDSHRNSVYNDVYDLVTAENSEQPKYKSRGLFPSKTIEWDNDSEIWVISGTAGGHTTIRFTNSEKLKCPPSSGWFYNPGRNQSHISSNLAIAENVENPANECDRELEITNSEKSHTSSIYNDIYELFSEDGKPVYKSRGQFPMKTITWDDENSMWTISGQAGGRV